MNNYSRGALRFNPIIAIGLLGLIAIPIIMLLLGKSPEAAAREFMVALTKGDVATLTRMTYLPDPVAPISEQWEEAFSSKARNYVYGWKFESSQKLNDDEAVVKVLIVEFRGPELHEKDVTNLPLVRKDGEWKVDVRSLTRGFFPGLPR